METSRRQLIIIAAVLGLAFVSRAATLWIFSENLSQDRDAYLAIAENLAEGNGYRSSGSNEPTAFRPPLYPLLLAGVLKIGGCPIAMGILQVLLGIGTVFLTWKLGRQLGLGRFAPLAALLVAVDPLSIQYGTFLMTETLFTFLVMLLFWVAIRPGARSPVQLGFIGILFGLCALCRPTIWAFGILVAAVWLLKAIRFRGRDSLRSACIVVLSVVVVVSPWLIRNLVVFQKSIFTTTHGGYTLLLGNNPVFYAEVVRQPWGTTWDSASPEQSQRTWFEGVKKEMTRELGINSAEWKQDRWMYGRARQNILSEPMSFLRSCCLRCGRFWNIVPQGPARNTLPTIVLWAIGVFYLTTMSGMLVGFFRLNRESWKEWCFPALLLLSFTIVHLFYWSNMRMRIPLIPIVSLLAVRGICVRRANVTEMAAVVE